MVLIVVFRQIIFSLPLFPPTVALPSEQVRASALLQRPVAAAVAFDSRRWWKSLGDPDKKFFKQKQGHKVFLWNLEVFGRGRRN